ncbi:MAG: uncharacterized protein A8A55_0155, partial [Amphiamblys sp. WSBS2006]
MVLVLLVTSDREVRYNAMKFFTEKRFRDVTLSERLGVSKTYYDVGKETILPNWHNNFFVADTFSREDFYELNKRPFALSIHIDNRKTTELFEEVQKKDSAYLRNTKQCDITIDHYGDNESLSQVLEEITSKCTTENPWKQKSTKESNMDAATAFSRNSTCMKR